MRTKLTLWKILDKYLDEYFKSGMCGYLERLQLYELITFNEVVSLKKEIQVLAALSHVVFRHLSIL